ncbi:LysR family transcriptional regulator [Bacillus sp. CGMCC 1.16541]|uniref:LysR family transcriptional regulator n=1 Tax=Bacillus sp. CGMCC 1.16541 TaxID=2185143 RepID=UPI001EF6BCB8|nr:LysR family transcriptional regulator [Bacillus sp. CGMCC 1.16541]
MEWQQLHYFQTIARIQHMTRAAEALYISQPTLSRSLARLEKELGVPLFDRQGRSLKLNQYGALFLQKVDRALQLIEEGKQELKQVTSSEEGTISLAFLHTFGVKLIPDLVGAYRQQHPNVQFQLVQNAASVLWEQLQLGEIDLCIASPPEDKSFMFTPLKREELCVIVPPHHHLATEKIIDLHDITTEPFIGFQQGLGLNGITRALCEQAGFTPNVLFEAQEVGTVVGLVSAGLGVAIIPDQDRIHEQVCKLKVRGEHFSRVIGMTWTENRYMPPVVKQFRDFVIEQATVKQS